MGSDLGRLLHQDSLPPFRNSSSGPPNSLPSLAQLGHSHHTSVSPFVPVYHAPSSSSSTSSAALAPEDRSDSLHTSPSQSGLTTPLDIPPASQAPSWTAVNHPHPPHAFSCPSPECDRGYHDLSQELRNQINRYSTPQEAALLRPKSTSHLGRIHRRKPLAPKKPISKYRQGPAAPESSLDLTDLKSSNEAQFAVGPSSAVWPISFPKSRETAQRHSSVGRSSVSPTTPPSPALSPVLHSPLGEPCSARAAIHSTARSPSTLERRSEPRYDSSVELHPSTGDDSRPAKRRNISTSSSANSSVSAPTAASALPDTPTSLPSCPRQRARSVRFLEQPSVQMPSPMNLSRAPTFPVSVARPTGHGAEQHTPVISVSEGPPSQASEAQRSISPSFAIPQAPNSTFAVQATSAGHVTRTGSTCSRNSHTPSQPSQLPPHTDAVRPSVPTQQNNAPTVCTRCNAIWQPPSIEYDPGQVSDYLDIVRQLKEHGKKVELDLNRWLERHQPDLPNDVVVPACSPAAEPQEGMSQCNKHQNLSDIASSNARSPCTTPLCESTPPPEGTGSSLATNVPVRPETHFALPAYVSTSGASLGWTVGKGVARLFGIGGVPAQHDPPPNDEYNMWYDPYKREHDEKRRIGEHNEPETARTQSEMGRSEADTRDGIRRTSTGFAPSLGDG